jgi:Rps23 Pro-64 3,4-dihydroxylase Tpa1-like proline 4-hydroxylase
MNLTISDYEILDLGLVYYKNVLENPQEIIDIVKSVDERYLNNEHGSNYTAVQPWNAWQNESAGTMETFCWQKFFPKPEDVRQDDYFYKDQHYVSKKLYDALDVATYHYSNVVYPFAARNIKSREYSVHLLRYEKGGYLPAHQDHGVSSRVLSVVMYLNNEYEGGELSFPNSKIKIKPEPGSIIFFPSNYLYVHEVAPIISGTRYSMPHWYHNMKTPIMSTGQE